MGAKDKWSKLREHVLLSLYVRDLDKLARRAEKDVWERLLPAEIKVDRYVRRLRKYRKKLKRATFDAANRMKYQMIVYKLKEDISIAKIDAAVIRKSFDDVHQRAKRVSKAYKDSEASISEGLRCLDPNTCFVLMDVHDVYLVNRKRQQGRGELKFKVGSTVDDYDKEGMQLYADHLRLGVDNMLEKDAVFKVKDGIVSRIE